VLYGDMKKVNTVIKSSKSFYTIANKVNKNIPQIVVPGTDEKVIFTKSGHVRVGNYLWIFGDGGSEACPICYFEDGFGIFGFNDYAQ